MAKVTITFEDGDGGDINIKMESDPPLPGPAAFKKGKKPPKTTHAQRIGMELMRHLSKEINAAYDDKE